MSKTLTEATRECEGLAHSLHQLTCVPGMPSNDVLELRAHLAAIVLGDEGLACMLESLVIESEYSGLAPNEGFSLELNDEEDEEGVW